MEPVNLEGHTLLVRLYDAATSVPKQRRPGAVLARVCKKVRHAIGKSEQQLVATLPKTLDLNE